MNHYLGTGPVLTALSGLESGSRFLSSFILADTWNGHAVLNGTAPPEEMTRFLAMTLIWSHTFTFYFLNMIYTVITWIFTTEQLAPWRFQGTKKMERSLLIKVIAYVTGFHVVISYVMYNYTTRPLLNRDLLGSMTHKNLVATLPTLPGLIGSLVMCLVATDFTFYWGHYALHKIPFLWRHVHFVHHLCHVSVGWDAEFAHPVELLFGNIAPVLSGPFLLAMFGGPTAGHPVVWFIWMILAMYGTVTGHSGFWYPSAIAGHHDVHHECASSGNYGTTGLWDKIMGTNKEWLRRGCKPLYSNPDERPRRANRPEYIHDVESNDGGGGGDGRRSVVSSSSSSVASSPPRPSPKRKAAKAAPKKKK